MKYPYDLARRLREHAQTNPFDLQQHAVMLEAAGVLEFMAEFVTSPQRDPPPFLREGVLDFPFSLRPGGATYVPTDTQAVPEKSNFEKFAEETTRHDRRCKCGSFPLGGAGFVLHGKENHGADYCWRNIS
jgi:hypothetical protein